MTGYLGNAIRPSILIILIIREYVKTFDDNKLMSFFTEYDELFEKNKSIRSKIEELKFTGLTVLSVYDDKYIETKIIPYIKN